MGKKKNSCTGIRAISLVVLGVISISSHHQLEVSAYFNNSGLCISGPVINKDKEGRWEHGEIDPVESLESGSLRVRLNDDVFPDDDDEDTTMGDDTNEGKYALAYVGVPHTITLERTEGFFKGFLFYLYGRNDEDIINVTGSFDLQSDADNSMMQILPSDGEEEGGWDYPPSCAEGVAAISHANRENKTSVSFIFTPREVGTLRLEVTVVVSIKEEEWYYSAFTINSVEGASPTPSSSSFPSTSSPSNEAGEGAPQAVALEAFYVQVDYVRQSLARRDLKVLDDTIFDGWDGKPEKEGSWGSSENFVALKQVGYQRNEGESLFDFGTRNLQSYGTDGLKDVVTTFLTEFIREALKDQEKDHNTTYAPFQFVVLFLDPVRTVVTDTYIMASYTGASVFEQKENRTNPSPAAMLGIQLYALEEMDEVLVDMLREESWTPIPTTNTNETFSITVAAGLLVDAPAPAPQARNSDEGSNDDDGHLSTVIIVAVVVASCATVVLSTALFMAWRRKKRREEAYKIGSGCGSGGFPDGQQSPQSQTTATKSFVKSISSRLTKRGFGIIKTPSSKGSREGEEGGGSNVGTPDRDENGVSEVDEGSVSPELYSEVFPESIISEDINTSISDYYAATGIAKGNGRAPSRKNSQTNDGASVSSLDSYGYSLDGYASSVAPSTQYGY